MKLQDAYYEQRFEIEFLRATGNAFQTLFNRLMGLAYKTDYIACRPWGNIGDLKNDGFHRSERRLFQAYAPNELAARETIAKITEDFDGAKAHWGTHFDKWSFVHNAVDGLPPHCHQFLLTFAAENPDIRVETWGLEELRLVFRALSKDDKQSWLGVAPDEEIRSTLGFQDLQIVLERVAARSELTALEVRDVPQGKIEANALSESVSSLLREGMVKTPMVEDLFRQWHDETLGERMAEAFRQEYQRLHGADKSPNEIFAELQAWAGGSERGSPEHEMAVLTVMAYYFERCDIFEEPRGASQ